LAINNGKRGLPKPRYVRLPKVDMGVEGVRVPSQASLLGASFKRNIGVPDNRGSVDLFSFPVETVQTVFDVCYKPEWQEIVRKHLEKGMWEPNLPDLDEFLINVDEAKAKRMLTEIFVLGEVDLTKWMFMAKGKVKASRDENSETKVDHPQTILFSESGMMNAYYSSMTKRFKRCVDECLLDEISLNSQRSPEDHEAWYNAQEPRRRSCGATYSYAADVKCFDRAQDQVPLRVDVEFYRRHGLDERTIKVWQQTHGVKKALSMAFGVVLWITLGGVSGIFKTLLRNGIVNLAAVIKSTGIQRGDIVVADIKGDDFDLEVRRPLSAEVVIEKMAVNFNLSAKFFTSSVRYMNKEFRIKVGGRWVFVADMWARSQSALTPVQISNHSDLLSERWQSLASDLRHYQNGIYLDEACKAAQQYYRMDRPPYGLAYALSKFARDKNAYYNFFNPPILVS